ncbi:MAG: hypothetical protein OCU18_02700 [Candidatus Syntrophoarchaeum sp.]|nr:hypothetical protein [Candidatus Syntrophoarchaeum sp.]
MTDTTALFAVSLLFWTGITLYLVYLHLKLRGAERKVQRYESDR